MDNEPAIYEAYKRALAVAFLLAPGELADRIKAACARLSAEDDRERQVVFQREITRLCEQSLRLVPRPLRRTPQIREAQAAIEKIGKFLDLRPILEELCP